MSTPWREHLQALNKQLKRGQHVNGMHVRGRVKTKPNQFGNHSLDLLGDWNNTGDITTRRLNASVNVKNLNASFAAALKESEELIQQACLGLPTRRPIGDELAIVPKDLRQIQKAQLLDGERYLRARAERMEINERSLTDQIRWLRHCFGYAKEHNREMSLTLCAEAMRMLYPNRKQASYKRSLEILKNVLRERLNCPIGLAEEDKPAYKTPKSNLREIPSEAEVRARLEAIEDPETQKLIYVITACGIRHMDLYNVRWETYNSVTGRARYWCSKVQKQCTLIPYPIDGFTLDLSNWQPAEWKKFYRWGGRGDSEQQRRTDARSTIVSRLYTQHMGFTSTDNRHRYCSLTLQSGFHTAATCAAAVGNSINVIGQTYANEIAEYLYQQGSEDALA